MDKGKKRSELLKAGRNKLQQFRNKNSSKSSSSGKPSSAKQDEVEAEEPTDLPQSRSESVEGPSKPTTTVNQAISPRNSSNIDQELSGTELDQCDGNPVEKLEGLRLVASLAAYKKRSENRSGVEDFIASSSPNVELTQKEVVQGIASEETAPVDSTREDDSRVSDEGSHSASETILEQPFSSLVKHDVDAEEEVPSNLDEVKQEDAVTVFDDVRHSVDTLENTVSCQQKLENSFDVEAGNMRPCTVVKNDFEEDSITGFAGVGKEVALVSPTDFGAKEPSAEEDFPSAEKPSQVMEKDKQEIATSSPDLAMTARCEMQLNLPDIDSNLARKQYCSSETQDTVTEYLYLMTLSRDLLQLQLDEQVIVNAQMQSASGEVNNLHGLLRELEDSKGEVCKEMILCQSELQVVKAAKEELETSLATVEEEMAVCNSRCEQLQKEAVTFQEKLHQTLIELTECRGSLEAIQEENNDLRARIAVETKEKMEYKEERDQLNSEKEKLLILKSELSEQLFCTSNRNLELESKNKEAEICYDHFAENIMESYFSAVSTLEMYKAAINEYVEMSHILPNQGQQIVHHGDLTHSHSREVNLDEESHNKNIFISEMDNETQKEQKIILLRKIDGLSGNIVDVRKKFDELQTMLTDLQQHTESNVQTVSLNVEQLVKQVDQRIFNIVEERDSIRNLVTKVTEKLNYSGESVPIDDSVSIKDISLRALNLAEFATQSIQNLKEKLELAYLDNNMLKSSLTEQHTMLTDVEGRSEQAHEYVQLMFDVLQKLLHDFNENVSQPELIENRVEGIEALFSRYVSLVRHLQSLLADKAVYISKNMEIESQLVSKSKENEELHIRCDSLQKEFTGISLQNQELASAAECRSIALDEIQNRSLALAGKLGIDTQSIYSAVLVESENATLRFNSRDHYFLYSLFPAIEEVVAVLLERYKVAFEGIELSKHYLYEVNLLSSNMANEHSTELPSLIKEELLPLVCDLWHSLDQRISLNIQLEVEKEILVNSLTTVKNGLETYRSELTQKMSELDQLEQKHASVKEKLGIAVTKGKGLIVQRDSLKQSLAEKTSELEKHLEELQLKQVLITELEAKLQSSTEVDRIQALESELSFVRNSYTDMRDMFLHKDSVLQKIEEVFEELELPEQFHTKDIIEKVDLLARIAVEISSGQNGPDARGDAVETSFLIKNEGKLSSLDGSSDPGIMTTDHGSQDLHVSSISESDEMTNRYDELQRRFSELADHNIVLEQSLMERDVLIQKWEEVLERVGIPMQFRTLDPQSRIEWLQNELSEIQSERDQLHQKLENIEGSSEMLLVDLEKSHKRISELTAEVVAIKSEKEFFAESLDKLKFEFSGLYERAVHDEIEIDNLRTLLANIQEELAVKTEEVNRYNDLEVELHELLDLVRNTLAGGNSIEMPSDARVTQCLSILLRMLVDEHASLASKFSRDNMAVEVSYIEKTELANECASLEVDQMDQHVSVSLHDKTAFNMLSGTDQQDASPGRTQFFMSEIDQLKTEIYQLREEKNKETQRYHSLFTDMEVVSSERDALQEQLNQEEQKTASLREKLNIAVKKGKGLVQHRDSLKQSMEELTSMMENLKIDHKKQTEELSLEKISLLERLEKAERNAQSSHQLLSRFLDALNAIDISQDTKVVDPIKKIEELANLIHHLQMAVDTAETEAKKSKRATDLLLKELNEAQEGVDTLQDKLNTTEVELAESIRHRDTLSAERTDALHQLESAASSYSLERKKQMEIIAQLNSHIAQLTKVCCELSSNLAGTFSKNLDLLGSVETYMDALYKILNGANIPEFPVGSRSRLSSSTNSEKAVHPDASHWLKADSHDEMPITEHLSATCDAIIVCIQNCDDLVQLTSEHTFSVDQRATDIFAITGNLKYKINSQIEHSVFLEESLNGCRFETKAKEDEILLMRRNFSLLYEACSISLSDIERANSYGVSGGNVYGGPASEKPDFLLSNLNSVSGQEQYEHIKSIADKLVAAIKHTCNNSQENSADLKTSICELNQQLQEKDMQIRNITAELSSQIRHAESAASQLSVDLSNSQRRVEDLEGLVSVLENEKNALDLRIHELKDSEVLSNELQEKVKCLTEVLSNKEQEYEAIMQALDEEEKEIEELEIRNKELEHALQEKEFTLKSLEVSKTKAMAKLSTTVGKFDELHNLSESLLAEVESLQTQLQARDSEISFLRQEVTRSTNELLSSEENNKKYSSQFHAFVKWLEAALVRFSIYPKGSDYREVDILHSYTGLLDEKFGVFMSELDDLRVMVQNKDSLLQAERSKVDELVHRVEALQTLSDKDSEMELLRVDRIAAQGQLSRTMNSPTTSEIEPVIDKASPSAVVPRGMRKANNDQVAIAIENEDDNKALLDEDDDKSHGFKPLTMSRFIPRATRPVADRIDGIWVSGDRLLMRQPTLRLGVLIYWIALHALLANLI